MYAVIQSGGKQHRVQVGDIVRVERLAGDPGTAVVFDRVLMIGGNENVKLGAPTLAVPVRAPSSSGSRQEVRISTTSGARIRTARRGHRQYYTR